MYRQYENPRTLEDELQELRERKQEMIDNGEFDDDAIEYFALREAELEERINFAWQDDEYEADCRREAYFYAENPMYDFEPYDCNGIAY